MALTLANLIANRTLSPEMAATLAAAAEERHSILFVTIPRMAGKSTLMQAVLQHASAGTSFHRLSTAEGPDLGIPASGDGGYLVVSEISTAPYADYLWGADTRRVFAALGRGFSLATALHAGGVDEAFEVLTRDNGVPVEQAVRIDLVVTYAALVRGHAPPAAWSPRLRRPTASTLARHAYCIAGRSRTIDSRWSSGRSGSDPQPSSATATCSPLDEPAPYPTASRAASSVSGRWPRGNRRLGSAT